MYNDALKSEIDKRFKSVYIRKMFIISKCSEAFLDSILYPSLEKITNVRIAVSIFTK